MKRLIWIVTSMMVLAISCQMSSQEIEETAIEAPLPTNRDSKGNIEYAKGMGTFDADYDDNYLYQVFFYETTDSFNEWKGSLAERYGKRGQLDCKKPQGYTIKELWPLINYNKVIVLVSNLDGSYYGVIEYYYESDTQYWNETFDNTVDVCLDDCTDWYQPAWSKSTK